MCGFDHAFGVRHHAQHIAGIVQHAGNLALRSVDRFGIAERDAVFGFQPVERCFVGELVAVMVRNRHGDTLVLEIAAGEQ